MWGTPARWRKRGRGAVTIRTTVKLGICESLAHISLKLEVTSYEFPQSSNCRKKRRRSFPLAVDTIKDENKLLLPLKELLQLYRQDTYTLAPAIHILEGARALFLVKRISACYDRALK